MSPIKCWATRISGHANNRELKVTQLKLQLGLFGTTLGSPNDKLAFEITGTATNKEKKPSNSSKQKTTPLSLAPFSKRRCSHATSSCRSISSKSPSLTWDERDLCAFHLLLKDNPLDVCDLAFLVLYGEGGGGEAKAKMTVVGKAEMSVTVAELAGREEKKTKSNSHNQFQRRLPIKLRVNGLCIEATLLVSIRLLKLRDSDSKGDSVSAKPFENSVQPKKKHGIIEKVKHFTSLGKKNNGKIDESKQTSPCDSDRSPMFDSDDSSNDSNTSSASNNSGTHNTRPTLTKGSERFTTSDRKTRLQKNRSLNGWNFQTPTTDKQQTQTSYPGPFTKSNEVYPQVYQKGTAKNWEFREIKSRDGKAKLKTNVFFASFDQMSERACGESACTVLVALIAHWLHSNHGMPTRAQFEKLITQGSSEWRRLCNSDYYSKLFPDKHFDLETIIEANLRPLVVLPRKSYTGFFSPEKFQCLKGAMSFDEIWDEIKMKVGDHEPRIYIVSWNDHFFVLKVERDAYYIIDSLGERLFEGCQQAFILKFDDSSLIYKKHTTKEEPSKGESREIICRGKECCKEFIKRFLAAIPLWQMEKEEKKWSVSSPYLHRQLQIDFHYSSSSSSTSSSSSSSSSYSSSSSSVTSTDSLWSLLSSGTLN
ncbi:uncharacterized protein LOC124822820 [Vigna umbellata]|uniref:uncharacterized protein LOC124822820 n=1 Tax=Vigna umbellata TaxID=87088 RepID=UPI001F5F6F4F|nr:uncharacterized protein LOC124822820 [Vigna umbellata]